LISTVVAAVAFTTAAPLSSSFPFVTGAVQFGVIASARVLLMLPLRAVRRIGRNFRNVLIVGSGPRAAYVKRAIDSRPDWGLRVIGFVDEYDSAVDASLHNAKLFKLDAMPYLLRDQVVDRVIIAYPRSMLSMLSPVVAVCASAGIPFTMLADLFGDFLPPPKVTRFGSLAALEFAPVHHDPLMLMVKRGVDIVGAVIGLLLSAPIVALAAIAIRLDDGGPVFFRQIRCGLNGRPFTMLKLRTMFVGADAEKDGLAGLNECDGPIFKCRNDPRVTRAGRLLRSLSIDELPQLFNVLTGDMSLVGPRPAVPLEVVQYQTFERRRLSMRPGITCLWQVSGRSNIGFDRWVQLDVKYIDSWSLGLDFLVLLKTIPAVLRRDGAH
jgi:exopolysaccharide biosynthesis polyprenyl glycosylphosphotransferase